MSKTNSNSSFKIAIVSVSTFSATVCLRRVRTTILSISTFECLYALFEFFGFSRSYFPLIFLSISIQNCRKFRTGTMKYQLSLCFIRTVGMVNPDCLNLIQSCIDCHIHFRIKDERTFLHSTCKGCVPSRSLREPRMA